MVAAPWLVVQDAVVVIAASQPVERYVAVVFAAWMVEPGVVVLFVV